MRITRRYLQRLEEGEVINATGAIQRNRNLKPRQRHQWSHVTVGPFPDHFKKAPVKKRTTLNTKKKDVSEGEVVTGNFQRGKNQEKRLHHGKVISGKFHKLDVAIRQIDRDKQKNKRSDFEEIGRAFGRSRPKPKSEETELDEKMITRRVMGRTSSGKKKTKAPFTSNVSGSGAPDPVLRHKSNTRAKMRAKGENPHKDESMDLIALTKKLLDAKTGELRKDVEVVKAEMAKIAEEKPVEKHK